MCSCVQASGALALLQITLAVSGDGPGVAAHCPGLVRALSALFASSYAAVSKLEAGGATAEADLDSARCAASHLPCAAACLVQLSAASAASTAKGAHDLCMHCDMGPCVQRDIGVGAGRQTEVCCLSVPDRGCVWTLLSRVYN